MTAVFVDTLADARRNGLVAQRGAVDANGRGPRATRCAPAPRCPAAGSVVRRAHAGAHAGLHARGCRHAGARPRTHGCRRQLRAAGRAVAAAVSSARSPRPRLEREARAQPEPDPALAPRLSRLSLEANSVLRARGAHRYQRRDGDWRHASTGARRADQPPTCTTCWPCIRCSVEDWRQRDSAPGAEKVMLLGDDAVACRVRTAARM